MEEDKEICDECGELMSDGVCENCEEEDEDE